MISSEIAHRKRPILEELPPQPVKRASILSKVRSYKRQTEAQEGPELKKSRTLQLLVKRSQPESSHQASRPLKKARRYKPPVAARALPPLLVLKDITNVPRPPRPPATAQNTRAAAPPATRSASGKENQLQAIMGALQRLNI